MHALVVVRAAAVGLVLALAGVPAGAQSSNTAWGTCKDFDRDPKQRIASCTRLLSDPKRFEKKHHPSVLAIRALAYRELGEFDKSIADFSEAIRLGLPAALAAIAFSERGITKSTLGDHAGAMVDLEEAVRLDPRNSTVLTNRARLRELRGDFDKSLADIEAALKLAPQDTEIIFRRASVRVRLGQFQSALLDLEQVVKDEPAHAANWNVRAWLKLLMRDLNGALADVEAALTRAPKLADAHDTRGWVRFRMGDIAGARADFDTALSLDPKISVAHLGRGRVRLEAADLDGALADLDQAVRQEKEAKVPVLAWRGAAYERKGIAALAVEDYRGALALPPRPNDPDDREAQEAARAGLARLLTPAARPADTAAATAAKPPAAAEPVPHRIALVIGNSAYAHVPALANPANDARAIAATLRRAGFNDVIERSDLKLDDLAAVLKQFGDAAANADWAVIYYAGHGIEVNGTNYVLPVDARLQKAAHVGDEAMPLDRLLSKVESARKLRLVILDACRNNPFAGKMQRDGRTRSVGRGLARIEPVGGTLIAYAARDGTEAADGEGRHSPYAEALMQHLEEPGLDIRFLFDKVRDSVLTKTRNEQMPFTYGSLPAERFIFRRE
jgi:tetratricopeptide (TPR) repeat protein